jgi:2-haloacid dehalogenase
VLGPDDIDTLVFDVLGTVVDEAGSIRAELAAALDQAGADPREAEALAVAWARHFADLVSAIRAGAPWRSTDDLNAKALAGTLRGGPALPGAAVRHLALAGHRLQPWPDTREALRRLAGRFTIVALSNGNLPMLTDIFAAPGLSWHCVLSGEMVHAYKPDPAVYRLAVDCLGLDPRRTLMVGAHPWDLRRGGPRAAHRLHPACGRRRPTPIGHVRPHRRRPGCPRAVADQDVTTLAFGAKLDCGPPGAPSAGRAYTRNAALCG